jgi:hypothetical protein
MFYPFYKTQTKLNMGWLIPEKQFDPDLAPRGGCKTTARIKISLLMFTKKII